MKTDYSQVFVLLTNNITASFIQTHGSIKNSLKSFGQTYIAFHLNSKALIDPYLSQNDVFYFTDDILHELNFSPIKECLIPGSNHFPLIKFYQQNPNYDYYWLIEDDVRFSGKWEYLISEVMLSSQTDADFMTCHLRDYQSEPLWHWWNTLTHPRYFVPNNMRIRSFNPIYRISNQALCALNHLLKDKWKGHHEVLMPSLLSLENFKISDFGGSGLFANHELSNQLYIDSSPDFFGMMRDGTIRFRPIVDVNEKFIPNKIYHPVKF